MWAGGGGGGGQESPHFHGPLLCLCKNDAAGKLKYLQTEEKEPKHLSPHCHLWLLPAGLSMEIMDTFTT